MLKTEAYFVILLVLMIVQQLVVIPSEVEEPAAKPSVVSQDPSTRLRSAQDDLPANSAARFIAAIMLSGRAIPLPAISNAVP
jgi:hypothetical protein